MPEEEKKEKKERITLHPDIMETLTVDSVRKRMRITLPEDLKEPETPQPKRRKKKEKSGK